ncbi:MAG TPA: DNA repair protein RadC [Alphaproteobacteria bacterium]|nr:DNA repair protein RadC [Alphaproteobacteria bacterium]
MSLFLRAPNVQVNAKEEKKCLEKPHYLGHRQRFRKKFLSKGATAFEDYELLELLLTYVNRRQDMKPLAKSLLGEFKTLFEMFSASESRLKSVSGVNDQTLVLLKLFQALLEKTHQQNFESSSILNHWQGLLTYLKVALVHETTEQFRLLFLDRKNELLKDEIQNQGTVDHIPIYPREVVKRSLELGATAVIMVHNHPHRRPYPVKS